MDFIQQVKDLIAAVRAGNWVSAISLALAILTQIIQGMGSRPATTVQGVAALADCSVMSECELADEMEKCCNIHESQALAGNGGPFIDAMLPILLALLRKLIGF